MLFELLIRQNLPQPKSLFYTKEAEVCHNLKVSQNIQEVDAQGAVGFSKLM